MTRQTAPQEREAMRRVRDPTFDPEEGFEWPGASEETPDADYWRQ